MMTPKLEPTATEQTKNKVRKSQKKKRDGGAWGLIIALISGVIILIAIFFLTYIFLGLSTNEGVGDNNYLQGAQQALWFTFLGVIILLLIDRIFGNKQSEFKKTFRMTYLVVGIPFLASTGVAVVVQYNKFVEIKQSSQTCEIHSTLQKALSATYPIATDKETGTSFAVLPDGTLVTAYHVIEGAKSIYVNIAGAKEPARVIRTRPEYDLALLKYDKPTPAFLDVSDIADVSEPVYALGWPANTFFAGFPSVTGGIVSRKITGEYVSKTDGSLPKDMSFIQTDAAINPGNSGGPLINKCGVIGVIDAISTTESAFGLPREEGVSYAIDGVLAKKVLGF